MAHFYKGLNLTHPDRFKVPVNWSIDARQRIAETQRWLKSPDLPGHYTIRERLARWRDDGTLLHACGLDYWFTQERTAMMFKLCFG